MHGLRLEVNENLKDSISCLLTLCLHHGAEGYFVYARNLYIQFSLKKLKDEVFTKSAIAWMSVVMSQDAGFRVGVNDPYS